MRERSNAVRDQGTGHAALSAFRMLAAAAKLGVPARFLTVLATVLSIGTALGDHALAAGMCAFVCVSHVRVTSGSLYAPHIRITSYRCAAGEWTTGACAKSRGNPCCTDCDRGGSTITRSALRCPFPQTNRAPYRDEPIAPERLQRLIDLVSRRSPRGLRLPRSPPSRCRSGRIGSFQTCGGSIPAVAVCIRPLRRLSALERPYGAV